ncbi:MAG: CvpA family protein [Alistipes sp.]|nr:CvpA family protein [Alistipes sp.]
MNVFDIIVYVALAWAVFNGWRRGFLLQMMSLVAVVAALYLSVKYCSEVGAMLGLDGTTQPIVGFIVIFAVTLILLTIAGYLMRKVFRFAGLGMVDILFGILFSVLKIGVIVSALFAWFAAVNKDYDWASKQTVEESRWFTPISGVVDKLTPYFEELNSEIFE